MLFLQSDVAAQAAETAEKAPAEVKESFFDMLIQGGVTMIPLGILFVLAIYIFIERYLAIKQQDKDPTQFMSNVRSHIHSGKIDMARQACATENSPFSRMILKGINRLGSPLREINSSIEAVGNLEILQLEKRLGILATIAGAAPMLGFFGTVLGMIQAFSKIAKLQGSVSPEKLAGPISTAMVTTAAGLAVGVVAYLGYNYLVNLVGRVIYKMEATSADFVDLLQEPVE